MIRKLFASLLGITLLALTAQAQTIVDFEDVTPRDTALAGSYWVSNPGFTADGVTFAGGGYGGYAVSDSTNIDGYGYFFLGGPTATAEVSAYAPPTGGGAGGSAQFAVLYGSAAINLPTGYAPASVQLTNTTTTRFSLLDGDFVAKKFGGDSGNDPDFFSVVFTGYTGLDATGSTTAAVEFFLADYRFANNALDYIVQSWQTVDLSPLGNAASIGVSWNSSDVGEWGINTPTYVALDNLTVIPEPASALFLIGASVFGLLPRRRWHR
jgi:hypothetical protein